MIEYLIVAVPILIYCGLGFLLWVALSDHHRPGVSLIDTAASFATLWPAIVFVLAWARFKEGWSRLQDRRLQDAYRRTQQERDETWTK